ncbi:unnamed protein product [Amoebophrya sp. A120]|nr:unnamed protein product [Amoebophrya sp. A120]|eukprot:GSA120T00025807001.1
MASSTGEATLSVEAERPEASTSSSERIQGEQQVVTRRPRRATLACSSRSATILEAVNRLGLLRRKCRPGIQSLRILILGPDATGEGTCIPEVEAIFVPVGLNVLAELVRCTTGGRGSGSGTTNHEPRRTSSWDLVPTTEQDGTAFLELEIAFVGPNVPLALEKRKRHVKPLVFHRYDETEIDNTDVEPTSRTSRSSPARIPDVKVAMCFTWCRALYHELEDPQRGGFDGFDVAFAFNAGLWGYSSWMETVRALPPGLPLVVTSYSLDEAESDRDALDEAFPWRCSDADDTSAAAWWNNSGSRGRWIERPWMHEQTSNRQRGSSTRVAAYGVAQSTSSKADAEISKLTWHWDVERNDNHGSDERPADYGEGVVGVLRDNAAWQCFSISRAYGKLDGDETTAVQPGARPRASNKTGTSTTSSLGGA